ncbi:MAG: hypothetical protein B7X53_08415 [Hyphomonas sp. 34-62-18]|nr:HlyD family efflux transporter periplasmic adaptor subunit [Hyphomonas sp. 34-62-18]OZB16640.1 MAG: hypothetical protein B7X53_08415 [Hyphomonas sp. 34-62-18]
MNTKLAAATLVAMSCLVVLPACGSAGKDAASVSASESGAAEEYPEGPHGGRLLQDGDFALEVTIFETGVPPQYRLYPYESGTPIDPSLVDLTLRLHRLGGIVDEFSFAPQQDYLVGSGVVTEPHSFEVELEARRAGKVHAWRYESFEGRTSIPDARAAEAGIVTEVAGPAIMRDFVTLTGTVAVAPSATAEVRAKYPGPVVSVTAKMGDTVQRGAVLARIESSASLQEYPVLAPISGTILERRTNVGDVAGAEALFVIADVNALEARLHVFPKDVALIEAGQALRLGIAGGELTAETKIDRFLPLTGASTQTRIASATIPAGTGLQPGMRVVAEVTTAEAEVPLAVRESGMQSFRDFTVVYAKVGDTYEVRMLELGKQDGTYAEVLGGLRPGEVYVAENSFLIKADIDKSGASHDH